MQNFLFDLDGTLTDPKEGITASVQYALKQFGITAEKSELVPFIGPPLRDSFMEKYGLSEDDAVRAVSYFRVYFQGGGMFENKIYEGIPDMLEALKSRGKGIYMVTSKPDEFARQILDHFGILQYFDFVAGNSMDEKRHYKEDVMAWLFQNADIEAAECCMIGDRKFDILAGKAYGMTTVGAAYGYPVGDELTAAGADYIAKTPLELKKLLLSL